MLMLVSKQLCVIAKSPVVKQSLLAYLSGVKQSDKSQSNVIV